MELEEPKKTHVQDGDRTILNMNKQTERSRAEAEANDNGLKQDLTIRQ